MQVPIESLSADTLKRVVEEFVTREGTDYGLSTADLNTKVDQVMRQLKSGRAILLFDSESETCHIASKDIPAVASDSNKKRPQNHRDDLGPPEYLN